MADDLGINNKERIQQVLQHIADSSISCIQDLEFTTFESITRRTWIAATDAARSLREAMELLVTIAYMDTELDVETLPELDIHAISAYGTTLGNRAYWQNNYIKEWLKGSSTKDSTGISDFRFDLDFDSIEEETTTETKTIKKTKKTRKKKGDNN